MIDPHNIKFYHSKIDEEVLIAKIRANPSLKEIFRKKKYITQSIDEDIERKLHGIIDNFYTLFIISPQGSFKTSVAQTFAKKHEPAFNIERIYFLYDPFREAINQSQPRETYNLDEAIFIFGTGSMRLLREIQNLIETLRKRQNSLIITSPTQKYFEPTLFTYVFECLDTSIKATCPKNPELHEPRECGCFDDKTANIKECYVRSAVKKDGYYMGFYISEIEWNNPLWLEYNKAKDEFMELMRSGDLHNTDYKRIANACINNPDFQEYSKNNKRLKLLIEQIAPTLTTGEAELVITQIRILQPREEKKK